MYNNNYYIYTNNMGKKANNLEKLENPFAEFSILKGEFTEKVTTEDVVDDIQTGIEGELEEELETPDTAKLAADKALEKIAKTQAKKLKGEEIEDEDPEEDEAPDLKTGKDEVAGFKEFANALYDKGIIDFNDEDEDFEESEEGLAKLINKTNQNRINKWAEALPEDFAKMLEFVQNGGKPKDFLEVYYGNHSWTDFKIETEEAQKLAVKESLRLSGETPEDVEEMVTEWFDNGTLEKRAKSAIIKLQKHETAQKEELVKIQKEQAAKHEASQKEYWDNFKKDLYSKEDVAGFKLTPKVKDKLWNFMTQVDRSGKTAYEQALEKNKDSSYLFAYLAMNNFDSKTLEKQVETKVSNNFSAMLKNYSNTTKAKISSGSTEEYKDENPFKAFKGV